MGRAEMNEAQLCPPVPRASEGTPMLDAHRGPLGWCPVLAPARVRALSLAVALLWLSGCLAHQEPSRDWLVYAREVPVARVTLAGASHGNVVDVAVRGDTAEVTLRHRGRATVTRRASRRLSTCASTRSRTTRSRAATGTRCGPFSPGETA